MRIEVEEICWFVSNCLRIWELGFFENYLRIDFRFEKCRNEVEKIVDAISFHHRDKTFELVVWKRFFYLYVYVLSNYFPLVTKRKSINLSCVEDIFILTTLL